jgi:hypothetical protein
MALQLAEPDTSAARTSTARASYGHEPDVLTRVGHADVAALERGYAASAAVGGYSPHFHDQVGAREYRGHDGIRQSLGLYQLVFSDGDLRIHVEDQVTEGHHVASHWARRATIAIARSGSGGSA